LRAARVVGLQFANSFRLVLSGKFGHTTVVAKRGVIRGPRMSPTVVHYTLYSGCQSPRLCMRSERMYPMNIQGDRDIQLVMLLRSRRYVWHWGMEQAMPPKFQRAPVSSNRQTTETRHSGTPDVRCGQRDASCLVQVRVGVIWI
jgi:hypothetical protein